MLHASTRKLIDRLAEMTELSKLDWTETEDGQISYSTEGYSVSLTESPNEVVITSKDGKELERASAEDLAATQDDEGQVYAAIVAAMTAEASRIARGTERAISTLLAGMDTTADEAPTEPVEEIEDAVEDMLAEDPVDDTTAMATDTIETIDPEPETDSISEGETEEASSEATGTDQEADEETDPVIAVEETDTESETVVSDDVEVDEASEPDTITAETAETLDELETVSTAETETDVTEAVARLADEVNQREESRLDEAAASAVGAVALAAGLAATSDEEDETEVSSIETEPDVEIEADTEIEAETEDATETELEEDNETETVIAAISEDEAPVSDTPAPIASTAEVAVPYVPFGLEEPSDVDAAPMALGATETAETVGTAEEIVDADPIAETALAEEDVAEVATPSLDTETISEEVTSPVLEESEPVTEAVDTTPDEETSAPSTVVPFAGFATETVSDASVEPEMTEPEMTEPETAEPDPVEAEPALATTLETTEPVSEPVETTIEEVAADTIDDSAQPAAPIEAPATPAFSLATPAFTTTEPAPELAAIENTTPLDLESAEAPMDAAAEPAPQSYSLSGIGAGFGLGALSAKTEASGVPGPSATPDAEKVIIDATDDVLPPIKGKLNLPPSLTEPKPSETEAEAAKTSTSEGEDTDILKPRTRFNPWD